MKTPTSSKPFRIRLGRGFFSLVLAVSLIASWGGFPISAYAGSETDDIDMAPSSQEDNVGFSTQYAGADGEAYVQRMPPSVSGEEALSIPSRDFYATETVYDQAGLQAALNGGVDHILIANDIPLAGSVSITNSSEYHVTIESTGVSRTITAASLQRHFVINAGASAPLYLSFQNVVLEGNAQGGGIAAAGTVTIGGAQINNCSITASSEGGGIYANGVVRVEGGSITNCKALRGGGIMCAYERSLTVVGVTITNNQANHTGLADSGLGGGIGVWQRGSLVAQNCTIARNTATGDTLNHKGLGGGIGVWMDAYSRIENCTITNNVAGNFGGGILSHWNSTLIVDGGTLAGNDVSASTNFGSGGGVCVAAGGSAQFKGGVVFSANKAHYGAGIRFEYGITATIDGSVSFLQNETAQTGGVLSCGGTDSSLSPSTLSIGAAVFEGNTARSGGCIYLGRKYTLDCSGTRFSQNTTQNSGGVLYANQESSVTLTECDMGNNKALYGGAIYLNSAASLAVATPLTLVRSSVHDNEVDTVSVSGQGGGILLGNYCKATLADSTVINNKGGYGGGLIVFNNSLLDMTGATRIEGNTATQSGGGIYTATLSTLTASGNTEIADNAAEVSGGGIYLSGASTVEVRDAAQVVGNQAAGYGGGIAGAQAKAITIRDQARVSGNVAQEYGGGIYAHTGDVPDRQTAITVQDAAMVSDNRAVYGAGISGAYPDMETNVPIISLEGDVRIVGNAAASDGGGVWVPHASLANVSAASGVVFADNTAERAYYMDSASPDAAIHAAKILTTAYSAPPAGAPAFSYAYNNYDIVYRDGTAAVTVTFDATGGLPALQTASTKQGESLGAAMAPDPSYEGYTFLGWYTEPDGGGARFDGNTVVNADMTVYAYWKAGLPDQGGSDIAQTSDTMGVGIWIVLAVVIVVAGGLMIWLIARRRK